MKRPWHYLTWGDTVVVAALTLAGLLGLLWLFAAPPGRRVVVSDGERVVYVARLEQPATVDLAGPLGTTRLVIDEAGARITAAPCPLKICMGMGPARRSGDLIACVPNRILVRIEGGRQEDDAYDLLSR